MSVHQALLFRQLSPDVALLPARARRLTDEQAEQFAARGITVVDGEVAAPGDRRRPPDGGAAGRRRVVPRDALVVAPRMVARAGFLAELGLAAVEHPSGRGRAHPGRSDRA